MEKYRLKNGITILFEKNSSKSVAVEIMFRVGSNYETAKEAGISHYLEHMLFEGTKKRKSSMEIANEIEKYGGEFNAYTIGDRTAYYIRIISSKFSKALEILSDMVINPVFDAKIMEKEKKVILREINMVTDDPRQHQWIMFQKNLFSRHPVRNPTYGSEKTVSSITRKMLFDYYRKHYSPDNMVVSVVGNVSNPKKEIEKYFGIMKPIDVKAREDVNESVEEKPRKFTERRKINNSYMVLGYKTVPRLHKDSYVLDIIRGILGRGQSGWMFDEIRTKRGLAYQVGVVVEHEKDYGYFAAFCGLDRKKIGKAKEIILGQFRRLEKVSRKELEEAKTYIEGNHALIYEDNHERADELAYYHTIKDAALADKYIKEIRNVSVKDVRRVTKKYLNKNYTLVAIEQK